MTAFHCYIEHMEVVRDCNIEADSPAEAAAKAAEREQVCGRWTVIPGKPVYIDVVERKTYETAEATT